MRYAKLINDIVVQIQPNNQDGFIEVDNKVVCGMIKNGEVFENPVVEKTEEEIYNDDWVEINQYFDVDIPKYTNHETGHVFDITTSSLLDMERKEKIVKDDVLIAWSTDKDNEFNTTKAELFIVLQKADELRQLKINEIRGF